MGRSTELNGATFAVWPNSATTYERSPSGAPLTIEAAARPFSRKTISVLRDASSVDGAKAWRALTDEERRSLLAYLIDDATEYREHRRANVAALAVLLAIDTAPRRRR